VQGYGNGYGLSSVPLALPSSASVRCDRATWGGGGVPGRRNGWTARWPDILFLVLAALAVLACIYFFAFARDEQSAVGARTTTRTVTVTGTGISTGIPSPSEFPPGTVGATPSGTNGPSSTNTTPATTTPRTSDTSTATRSGTVTRTPTPSAIPPLKLAALPVGTLQRVLKDCVAGVLAYRPPSPMDEGESREVVVNLGQEGGVRTPTVNLPGTEPVQTRAVDACRHMRAELSGAGFEIKPTGDRSPDRILGADNLASWSWSVTPTVSGDLSLDLQVFAIVEDLDAPVYIDTYRELIKVHVNRGYELQNAAKTWWPLTGLSIPVIVGGIFAAIRVLRRGGDEAVRPDQHVVDIRVGIGEHDQAPPKSGSMPDRKRGGGKYGATKGGPDRKPRRKS